MTGTYRPEFIVLSLLVAMVASYTALNLVERIASAASLLRQRIWLLGGAASLGAGIWSMHFIGMLALSMPIRLGYDLHITLASLAIAVFISYIALYVVTRQHLSRHRLMLGALLLGAGIAAMHYTGMSAMRMTPALHYGPILFSASLAIAFVASLTALRIAYGLRVAQRFLLVKRLGAAAVMGLAITGMHYTGMAAVEFAPNAVCGAASGVSPVLLALTIGGFTLAILAVTLMLTVMDSRYDRQATRFHGSLNTLNEKLVRLATMDSLTGLPNRDTLSGYINQAIVEAAHTPQQFAVAFMDLDGFKTINDSLGHSFGDSVLKAFAQRLQESVRRLDVVARLGGDEFVALLGDLNGEDDATHLASKILKRMETALLVDDTPLRLTPSIGIALYPRDGTTVEALLKNADAAMYCAKQAGRNTFRFFDPTMSENATRALTIQRDLPTALESGNLSLHFQPKFNGVSRELSGVEALMRWRHPELGMIPPLEFIPIAERSGQIVQIGYWVVAEACRHIQRWAARKLPAVKVALNLSPQQLRLPNLVNRIDEILAEHAVAPSQIMFEITESVAMQDAELTATTIRALHERGFEVAIDDFGTGYSSLAYLQRFRVKQLKIDQFFTGGLDHHGPEAVAIVSAIIALAHALGMNVVAEGVETQSQLTMLNTLKCDQIQGYLLSKPLAGTDFEAFLDAGAFTALKQEPVI